MADHLSGYQARDWDVVDYQMYQEEVSGLWFRGPRPELHSGQPYIVCLGAAQTFGCFCTRPFPLMLQEQLGVPVVNLGYGGAGPRFYVRHPELLPLINGASLVVVQIMSARSEDNRLFESGGLEYLTVKATGRKIASADGYQELLDREGLDRHLPSKAKRALRLVRGPRAVRAVIGETRSNWIESYRQLFAQISAPTALFWFSQRRTWLNRGTRMHWWWQRYDNANAMFGEYPQLVNADMVKAIRPLATDYVETISRRGSPQRLFSRFTGEPITVDYAKDRPDLAEVSAYNPYYPSPEMHEDAAQSLRSICRQRIGS